MDKLDRVMGWAVVAFIIAGSICIAAGGVLLWREVLR